MKIILLIMTMTMTDPTAPIYLDRFPPPFETIAECASVGKEVSGWAEEAVGYMCVRWPTPFDDYIKREFYSN